MSEKDVHDLGDSPQEEETNERPDVKSATTEKRFKKLREDSKCMVCERKTRTHRGRGLLTCPMLRDEIWLEIAPLKEGFMCRTCAQIRLKRIFKPSDLTPCLMNQRMAEELFPHLWRENMESFFS